MVDDRALFDDMETNTDGGTAREKTLTNYGFTRPSRILVALSSALHRRAKDARELRLCQA
jgi:hypothetical protein